MNEQDIKEILKKIVSDAHSNKVSEKETFDNILNLFGMGEPVELTQEWVESDSKTGWEGLGWVGDKPLPIGCDYDFGDISEYDKYYNPIRRLAKIIFTKEYFKTIYPTDSTEAVIKHKDVLKELERASGGDLSENPVTEYENNQSHWDLERKKAAKRQGAIMWEQKLKDVNFEDGSAVKHKPFLIDPTHEPSTDHLKTLATDILNQVRHNLDCGKDDKFTVDEVSEIIESFIATRIFKL